MCCIYDSKLTKKLKRRFKKGIAYFYKVINKNNTAEFLSNYCYEQGWNKAEWVPKTEIVDGKNIYNGIHVFTSLPKNWVGWNQKIIKVKVMLSDLIGAGNMCRYQTAVFKKVFVYARDIES